MTQYRECEEVCLNGLPLLRGLKHADKMLICGDIIIVVEETDSARLDDIKR